MGKYDDLLQADVPAKGKYGDLVSAVQELPDSSTEQKPSSWTDNLKSGLDVGMESVARGLLGPASLFLSKEQIRTPLVSPEQVEWAAENTPSLRTALEQSFPGSEPQQIVTGLGKGFSSTLSSVTSPENIALLGVAPESRLAQGLVAGTFLGQSLLGTPEQWQQLRAATTTEDKTRIATEMGLGLALPTLGLAHSFRSRSPTEGIRETLKTEEPTNAETTGTQTETRSGERPPELESGQEGRLRLRDAEKIRLATGAGEETPQPNQRLVSDQEKLDRIRKALGQEIAVEERTASEPVQSSESAQPVQSDETPIRAASVEATEPQVPTEPLESIANRSQPESATTTGVANRILEEEAKAGKIGEVQPGEGLSWEEMVDRGRSLLNEGADPQMIARRFQRNGRISADDFAVVRAERERLAVETNKAEQAARANPNDVVARDAYNAARATETDWVRNVVQPAKTATSDIFRGMQGEAPVDVSTFAGLRKAVLDMKGRDLKPNELRPLQERATNVQRAVEAEAAGVKKLGDAIDKHLPKVKAGSLDDLRSEMSKMAEELTPCR